MTPQKIMSTIELCGVTALFGFFLETKKKSPDLMGTPAGGQVLA